MGQTKPHCLPAYRRFVREEANVVPVTAAETVALRPYEQRDLGDFSELFGDAEVMRYVGDGKPLDADDAASLLNKIFQIYETDPSFFVWAVQEGTEYAGHAELKRRSGREEYEIVYLLERKRLRRALGGKVVDLLISEARARELPFIIATVEPENHASLAILAKRGFVPDDGLSRSLGCNAYRLHL